LRLAVVVGALVALAGFTLGLGAAPADASASGVVISEFRTRGPVGGNDEFIELRNAGPAPVDISGWLLQGCASGSPGNASTRATVDDGVVLAPGQSYLFANTASAGYSGTVEPDQTYATGITDFATTNFAGIRLAVDTTNVVDGVGAPNSPCREGTGFVTPGANGDNSFERVGGTTDTGNNATDFVGPKPGNPQNSGPTGTDDAPTVTDTDPSSDAIDVPQNANVSITFSEPVTTSAAAFSITCDVSGSHTFAFGGGPTTYTLDPDSDFAQADTCTVDVDDVGVEDSDADDPPGNMAADYTFSFSTVASSRRIYEIQGASHTSPYAGQLVSAVPGVVTAVRPNSLYVQDAIGDGNDATSDAILVFGVMGAGFAPGQAVLVSGRVTEFRPGGAASTNLTTTEITSPTVTPAGPGAAIAPTVVGQGGRVPPTEVIEDDASGSVETSGVFDPATDGIDFYESMEAMLLQINNPVVTGPRNSFGEVWVLADDGANAFLRTIRGGILVRQLGSAPYPHDYAQGDFNPERIQLEDDIVAGATPAVNVGDHFTSAAVGVLEYNFGNFEVMLTSPLTRVDGGLVREVATAPKENELTVATFNVENLDPSDAPTIPRLAEIVVDNLRSPDLIGIEEMQDNTGGVNDGTTDASLSWQAFIAAIEAAGGPTYEYRQIDPQNNQDGGQPGGNIRVGFLFRPDRGLAFVDRPGGNATTPTGVFRADGRAHLTLSPGRVDPLNPAWTATRKPLAGEFTWNDKTLIAIVNHFSSKGGDQPLFGRFQPPARSSEDARHQQAASVNAFVKQILAAERKANVIVLGDINDFEFSQTTQILEGNELQSLLPLLPSNERYSYVFEGNSQVLDQILFSENALRGLSEFDVVHVNAEFHDQASDHDPSVARLKLLGGGGGSK
jgi:endonuclease/exonuclease/phosphatase family metal-dependent hydrolase